MPLPEEITPESSVVKYDNKDKRRRSIRLSGYDYRNAGAYFVTICVQDRVTLLGRVVGRDVCLNKLAKSSVPSGNVRLPFVPMSNWMNL
jgi:hypothetical protein